MDWFLALRAFCVLVLLLLIAPPLKAVPSSHCTVFKECCVPESKIEVKENSPPGQVISKITIMKQPVLISPPSAADLIHVVGDTLQLSRSLDFEALETPVIITTLLCGPDQNKLTLYLVVINVNDNSPAFLKNKLDANISELFPVGQPWITVSAVDLDQDPIFYSLDNNTDGANFFLLKSENTPELYLTKALDYEKEKMLTLVLNCKEMDNSINISDTVTITIHVTDEDNKPPEFQPCLTLTDPSFCLNAKYTGKIIQYQTETGPLSLQPNHILAVDGDTGINATILYQIVSDNYRAFSINESDGTLTMTRAINSSSPITLTILAKQADDPYKYTMTSVTLTVLAVNGYRPTFPQSVYSGSVQAGSPKGSIVTKRGSSTLPLRVQAQDQDYPNQTSPYLKYLLSPSDLFSITEFGLIFTKDVLTAAQSEYNITVTAMDVNHGDNDSARINLLVSSPDAPDTVTATTRGQPPTKPGTDPPFSGSITGVPMSTVPPPAPPSVKTTAPGTGPSEPVTHTDRTVSAHTSKNSPRTTGTTDGQPPGPQPTATKPPVIGTTPNLGTSGAGPSSSKQPDPGPGVTNNQVRQLPLYDAKHMAAVGVPLSLLLVICMIIIGILLRDGGWAKFKRKTAKVFSRQSGDPMQFTNQGFLVEETLKSSLKTGQLPQDSTPVVTASALHSVLEPAVDSNPGKLEEIGSRSSPGDECDQNSLEEVTTDGEVKSILTKERKTPEGYKAVWFKEDIEPQANEERVIECPEDDEEGGDGPDNDDDGFYSNL